MLLLNIYRLRHPGAPAGRPRLSQLLGVIIALALLVPPACSPDPSPLKSAYQAVKRLEARAGRAASYDDFAGELESARSAVHPFLAGEAARKAPKPAAHIQEALYAYELSAKLWHILRQVGQSSVANNIKRVCIRRSSSAGLELAAYLTSLGALPSPASDGCPFEEIEITRQMNFLWEHAQRQLRLAGQALEP